MNEITTPSGLKYTDLTEGTGREAKKGDTVEVHYTGWLKSKDKPFDSSVGGRPFSFTLGAGRVIKGWDEGVDGMKIGGKRLLVIPSELGYGKHGAGADIPPDSTLHFEVSCSRLNEPFTAWRVSEVHGIVRSRAWPQIASAH